jgi:hypothetical protein
VIISQWISMREQWSSLMTTDHDGVRTWDTDNLSLGFTGADITCERLSPGFFYDFTVDDASDWYVSQRADWFTASETDSTTLRLQVSTAGFAAIEDMTASERRRLFRGMWVYCRRISDGAIGVFDCEGRGLDDIETGETLTGS